MDNTNNRKTGSGKLKQQILSLFKNTAFVRNSNLALVKSKSAENDKDNLALEIKELKKLRLVFEQTPGAIFILDTNFRFEYVNPGYEKLSGFSKAELIGKSVTEIFSQTDYTEPREEIVKSMIAGEKWEGEMQTYKKDGSTYWATTVSSPFKDDNGNLEGYIIIQQDVSDRKKIESDLRESEGKYKTLVENSHDGIMIIRNFKVLYANDTICNMMGYCLTEHQGDIVHPDDRYKIVAINELRRSGDTSTIHETLRLIAHNGEIKECEATSTMIPFEGDWAAFYTIHDVTEHNRFEQELKKSEQKYRELTEMLPIGVYELDLGGHITYINHAGKKLFNFDARLDTNPSATSFFSNSDSILVRENLKLEIERLKSMDFIAEQEPVAIPVEYTAKCEDGSEFPVLIYLNYIYGNNKVIGFRGIIIDISERKTMENALRESEEKYKTLVENSQDGILIIRENKILFANNTIGKMLDFSVKELHATSPIEIIHPQDHYKAKYIGDERRFKNNVTINESIRLVGKSGKVSECEITASIIDFQGDKAGFFSIQDTTENKRIQNELYRSELRYHELAEMLPLAVYELDVNGIPTYMNQTGLKLIGLEKPDFDCRPAFSYFKPADREVMISKLSDESRRTKEHNGKLEPIVSPPVEYTICRPDGTEIPVIIYGTSIIENGTVTGSRGIFVDISERKALEITLRESEEKYKALIENSQDGIIIVVDNDILFANNTFCNMLGYTLEELYTLEAVKLIANEDVEKAKRVNQLRKSGNKETLNDLFKFRTKKGTEIDADVYSSVLELNGQTVSYITVHDLTQTRLMQKQLEESEEKYRTLIENATDGIVIVQDGFLKFANQTMCDIMRYSLDELKEKPFLKYIDNKDHEILAEFHNRRMKGEQFSNILRSKFIRKDKKMITVELNARTSNYNGSPAGFIVIRDITERLKIEHELQHAKTELEKLNSQLEKRVKESSKHLTEARTQLINLQKENLQSQYDVLKQQVNPHFLFNSLNVLTSLIKLEPDLAEKFSEQLSKVYRYVLENKDNELVDLQTELNFLDAYIFLLNIRFIDKLRVNINISEERRNDRIIPLAMQLLIENAIKHNTMSKAEPLIIDIFIDFDNNLNIINNLQERPSQLVSTGVGLKNIENRYKLLNNTIPTFAKTDKHFVAKVPLVCE